MTLQNAKGFMQAFKELDLMRNFKRPYWNNLYGCMHYSNGGSMSRLSVKY